MTKRCCANCIYSFCSLHMRFSGFLSGFGVRPLCSNHPDTPGRLRPVLPGGLCRRYRPKPVPLPEPGPGVRRLALDNGQSVLVDEADFEWLNRYKWTLNGSGYAARREKGKVILMHREIMRPPKGKVVDHRDGCRLNNTRANLRNCRPTENVRNQAKHAGCSSQHKGVYFYKNSGKWCARTTFLGIRVWLGCFDDEAEAARVYDRKVVELFGEFARLNFPDKWPAKRRAKVYAEARPLRDALKKEAGKSKGKKGKGKCNRTHTKTPARNAKRAAAKPRQTTRRTATVTRRQRSRAGR